MTGSHISIVLDVPPELTFQGIVLVGTVGRVSLPVCCRRSTAVSVVVQVDLATCDDQICDTEDHCPFHVAQPSFLLNAASSQNVQVVTYLLIVVTLCGFKLS